MGIPIIRQGRYIDSRDHSTLILTSIAEETVTFNGNITITLDEFNKYFKIVNHDH